MHSVLIVDDESHVRALLARWIAADGYETREAFGAEAALDEMAARAADVVFCDMQMPGKDGRWLVGQVRARFPTAAVVLATADTTVPPMTSMQVGVIAYLVKPFNRETVLEAIRQGVAWHTQMLTTNARDDHGADFDDLMNRLDRPKE